MTDHQFRLLLIHIRIIMALLAFITGILLAFAWEYLSLALRRTVFLDGEKRPNDYEVRHDGRTVGRIYRMRSTGRLSQV